ncbi:MAG: arginine deiminase-related protein [Rhodothermales bacterium]
MVVSSCSELAFSATDQPRVPRPGNVLMTTPAYFDVQYVINPHMVGHIGDVDGAAAQRQWLRLRRAYDDLGFAVHVLDGVEGLSDMVFCANQTLPVPARGSHAPRVVMSRMHAVERRGEVPHFEAFFRKAGYAVVHLPDAVEGDFEGMGDGIWHVGRRLLWGGYGIRSDRSVYDAISEMLDVPVIVLRLVDDDFYHLDTCFCTLDERTVLIYPGAFDDAGIDLIRTAFDRVIEAPDKEARRMLACNAHCPDEHHVLIQSGSSVTVNRLRRAGFEPVEVDTSEFLKAGGSVFCMKQMFW